MKSILVSFFVFLTFLLHSGEVSEILKLIPQDDLSRLNSLFSVIIKEDHGAYTLFGDKPVSLSGDFEITPWENIIERIPVGGIFWKNWSIWEKYKHLFPLKRYLLIKDSSESEKFKISHVFLVNKTEFIKVINDNLSLFEHVLGHPVIPEQILSDLESGKISFLDSISNNEMLLGILLGYGKINASLYNKREWEGLNDAGLRHSTIKLEPFGDYAYSPLVMQSIHFVADLKHPETKALQRKYQKLREKISAIYSQGDFLEITLSQLIAD